MLCVPSDCRHKKTVMERLIAEWWMRRIRKRP